VKKICIVDQVEFESKRKDARFCSPNCRKKYARDNNIDEATGEVFDPTTAGVKTITIKKTGEPKAYDREKNLQKFIKMGVAKVNWLPTGIEDFDLLTMIPRGRVTQIQGPFGVGKTTLCLNMIKGLRDKKVFYVDSEASLNPELLVDLELDPDNFHLYNESAYFEDIAEQIRSAAKSGEYDAVIFDSLAAVTTKSEAEGDFTSKNIGQKAFLMHKLLHLTQMDFKATDTAFIVINQERDVIGSYVPQKYTPGGNAVPYAASLIIALKTIKSWRFPQKPKDGVYLGHEVEATIIKSKVNQPWRTKKFKLYYPNPVPISEAEQEMNAKGEF
jgi:RecA/RadA recombinase